MAAARGLNKGRGLGSLIPPKAAPQASLDEKKTAAAETGEINAEETKSTAAAGKTAKLKAAEKKTAGKKTGGTKTDRTKTGGTKTAGTKTAGTKPAGRKKAEGTKPAAKKTVKASVKTEAKTTESSTANKVSVDKVTADKVTNDKVSTNKVPADKASADRVSADRVPTDEVLTIRLTEIVPNREQPRKQFDEAGIEELAASIKEHGIVTPLLVRKKGKYYELVAGERRWRAAKLAGLKKIPVLLREFSEQQAAEIALIENIQRENLNAMEEAQAFRRLQEEFSLKQEDIAKRVSRSRSAIANSLRLLKLEESVQEMLAEGKLSMGHARALLALENPEMQKVTAEQIVVNDLSVRETEKLVKRLLSPKKTVRVQERDEQREAVYRELEERLRKEIGTRVYIRPKRGKKGAVEIEYYSDEDLERIIARLQQS